MGSASIQDIHCNDGVTLNLNSTTPGLLESLYVVQLLCERHLFIELGPLHKSKSALLSSNVLRRTPF